MTTAKICRLSILFSLISLCLGQDTLTIMTYNSLRFSANDVSRAQYMQKVIDYIDPDIVALQEIEDQGGIDFLLNQVFNTSSQEYLSGPLSSSRDMENGIIYKKSKVELTGNKSIATVLRDISGFTFSIKDASAQVAPFTVFSAHLKASTGSSNANQRWEEAKQLQSYIKQQDKDYHYILAGDLNLYSPNERAYKLLVDSMSIDLQDPIGKWVRDDNSHVLNFTQSTRAEQIGDGGSTGGLDDRFDFILFSDHFTMTDPNLKLLEDSYVVIGNDGNHFNRSIIDGPNTTVPSEVAEAIYYGSDHYPVIAKIIYTSKTSTSPVAHAGNDQNASIGETISLDGTKSYDPNGTITSYLWTQISGPLISISNSNSMIASFAIPEVSMTTKFSFKLTVTDNDGETGSDQVNITVPITSGFTPYDIQLASEKGIGDDCYPSQYVGQNLEVTGIVTGIRTDEQYPNFFIQDPLKTEWAGVFVYVNSGYDPPAVGSQVQLTADIKEYYGLTELANLSNTSILSSNNKIDPIQIDVSVLSNGCTFEAEIYEGMLVYIENVKVTGSLNDKNQFFVSDSTNNEVIIDKYMFEGDLPEPQLGTVFKKIAGIVHYNYEEYKIMPRENSDLEISDSLIVIPETSELLIYPNPSKSTVNFKLNESIFDQGNVKIEIIDINGRTVMDLFNGELKTDKLIWNGRTFNGKEAPTGIYFFRMEMGSEEKTQKFVMLR